MTHHPNVRPEIVALIERGSITPVEVAELRCNSWEWKAIIPAMTDEAFLVHVEHALKNCGFVKHPCSTYDEAVAHVHAPELVERLRRATAKATVALQILKEMVSAIQECEGDGGCRAMKIVQRMRT